MNIDGVEVRIITSARRQKTVQARWENGAIVIRMPAHLSSARQHEIAADMVAKLRKRQDSTRRSDADLAERAARLNAEVLESKARLTTIRWVHNQTTRWGSCTPATGEIRISDRLEEVPDYVLDAVIVHELVHTFIHSGHSAEFWEYANRAAHAQRAAGFLEAWGRFH